ncbi:hypothetical protein Acr_00g0061650 [Actinidia rufa]|uniref:Uncharacterized protein n=1 Tax=Actinidia rufa TaxID=165716 RepID=A0A7J0DQL0_9ERIC|nr:hypothetical protein Acr_00g0061650 [Actinidia rufa]
MENQYKDDSSSSFTADLFGSKQPTQPSSSTGFFASIFPPPKRFNHCFTRVSVGIPMEILNRSPISASVLPIVTQLDEKSDITYHKFRLQVVGGSNSSCSELPEHMQKQSSGNYHAWSTKQGTTEVIEKTEGESNIMTHKEMKIFQERAEPCPLSSSLYYGGPEDMYIHSSSTPSLDSFPIFKKDAVEGDPNGSYLHSASRGNWWQGKIVVHADIRGHFIIETLPYKGCEVSIFLTRYGAQNSAMKN